MSLVCFAGSYTEDDLNIGAESSLITNSGGWIEDWIAGHEIGKTVFSHISHLEIMFE